MENKQPLTTDLLRLSADKTQLLLLITPVNDEVSVPSLTRLFQSSDHADLKLNLKGLNKAVQSFTRLETQKERGAELDSVAIADRLHAQLEISFGPLKMIAKAVVISAYGGLPLSMEQLKEEMDELEITEGIITKTLTLLVEKSKQAKAGSSFQASIAKGIQPVQGTDTTFKRLVETPKERLLKPKKNEDGTVDMRNLGQLITVKPDTQLMRKIPCIEGTDGITVTGEVIPHESGKDFTLEVGENTHLCETDENLLLASLSGIPKVFNNGMKVDDVLIISNVDVGYGNVEYEGSVIIEGDVCDGMAVKATGDITILGFVESAYLECGGDLMVGKGIIGHQVEEGSDHYSCEIKSEGSVSASFSQYSKIEAGHEVSIKKQLLHCKVSCKGDINVIDDSGLKGTILGGFLSTTGGVHTVSMGANAGSKTYIDLIGNYPKLMENKKKINHTIHEENDKLQSLIDAQRKIDMLPNSEKKQTLAARLMLTREEVKKYLSELNTTLNDNKADLQSYFENAKVVTEKEMFNDVNVCIGRDKFRSIRKYGPTKVSIKDFKLLAEPYKK
jgi:uncharacterized protein (DUF342 family)